MLSALEKQKRPGGNLNRYEPQAVAAMIMKQLQPSPPNQHAEFHIDFIWVALAASLFIGFAIGAHVASIIGFDFPLGPGFYSFIQVHGHVQLVAWVGLFIISISLHFIPRLAGVPLAHPQRISWILRFITAGLMLRSLGQCVLPYIINSKAAAPAAWLTAASGLLEWLAIVLYTSLLLGAFRRVEGLNKRPGLFQVAPFFLMMLLGWNIYAAINFVLLIQMALQQTVVVHQAWNEFALQVFLGLVLLPVAFAFSVRMFPLYLRLPAIDWPVRKLAYAYILAFSLQTLPNLPVIASLSSSWPRLISGLGMLLKGAVILFFVWKLDLLTRRRLPWTVNRIFQPGPERTPTRPGLPDYGEFGSFERLVYSAYFWLVLAAILEILSGSGILFDFSLTHSSDAIRHVYLLGFITLLIFGMAVRMIPGFMHQKKVWRPKLVGATFWLGNLAAISRILPLLLPMAVFDLFPVMIVITQAAFGLSGIFVLVAVVCLTVNLGKTV